MTNAVLKHSRQVEVPQGLILTDKGADSLGDLKILPVEILLTIFKQLSQVDLKSVSQLNPAIRGIVVAGTKWGLEIQAFRVFNSALCRGKINYSPGVSYRLDWSTQKCIFENFDGTQKSLLAEATLPAHCAKGWSFPLNDHSLVWIGDDHQACGRLDINKENFTVSFTSLSPFLSTIPEISLILNSISLPRQIYGFNLVRKGADLHLTLRISRNGHNDLSEHFLVYEIDLEKPSSCYVGKMKDYCRTKGAGAFISRVQKVALENGLKVAQQLDKPREIPRRSHWEVIGFSGDWLIVHTFIYQNRPSQPDKNSKYHLLNKCTLIEEGCVVKSSISLTNHINLQVLYLRGNVWIFADDESRIICIDQKLIRLTLEGQAILKTFNQIDEFSYSYQGNGSLEIQILGKTERGEKISVKSSAHPLVPMSSLLSSPPEHFPQMSQVIPPLPIAPPLLQRNVARIKWALLATAVLGFAVFFQKAIKTVIAKMSRH